MTIKSIYTSLLLWISLISFSLAEPVRLDHVVAVVDDDIIMNSELQQRIQSIRKQNKGKPLPDNRRLREQILERMILDSIQLQMADRGGVRINDNELNEAISRIAKQNNMSLSQFRKVMESEGVSYTLARDQIRNEMRISRVQRFQVGNRIQITDQDVDHFLASDLGKMSSAAEYDLGHILISVPSQATPQQIQQARAKADKLVTSLRAGEDFRSTAISYSSGRNALKGGGLGWRKEGQLPGIFADAVPKLNIGDITSPIQSASGFHIVKLLNKRGGNTQLVTQYKVRHILLQPNELRDEKKTAQHIQQLYKRLTAGEDLSILAREFSNDPGSAASGGELGWVNPGDMVPAFDKIMQAAQPGQISKPFKSRFGWHILQVDERKKADIGVEKQRNQVRNMLYSRRFDEELPIWLRKIRSEAYVDIKEKQ